MTREEILAMKPGKELNMKVAEVVMGRKVTSDEIFGDMETYVDDDGRSTYEPLQLYSEDVSAAQLVVERMIKLGQGDTIFLEHYGNGIFPPPDAICRMALLVVLAKDVKLGDEEKTERKRLLLNDIIEIELDMFQRVRTAEPSLCQERPETFKEMRWMTHSILSTETLESYLEDLQKAKAEGRNLLTEKYARMQNVIPPLKANPVIEDIVRIEAGCMKELSEKYPRTFKGVSGFEVYLHSELETYSDKTLELYFSDVSKAEKEGRNLAEERYTMLFQQIGYGSIAEVEEGKGKN